MQLSRSFWLLAGLVWIVLLASGWHVLLRHELTFNDDGSVPTRWPADSALSLHPDLPTLVLFAHRSCPCTRITLQEMDYILTNASARVRALVILLAPANATEDRVGTDIERRARALPGAEVVIDPPGREARRFHVRTSGHVVLYGPDGRLLFSGGITPARGHAGDSPGRRAVLAWLRQEEAGPRFAPVYGCSLFADESEIDEEVLSWNP
jgi:hypothetical protein